ncbi:MAG: T9SS type A sorting domain-containing protein [Bacteroidetes bacterium]|nr:T9SS type A sorting domain-containing protein [Bacteroidota bacterium]
MGTDDANVWKSEDYGDTWEKITDGLPYRYCMSIETDPLDAKIVYVTFSGFRWAESIAHIYKSTDAGETWLPIDGDMPDIPVNDIQVFHRNDTLGLVAATDVGVYYSYNDGVNWSALGTTMPIVSVYEMYYDAESNYIFAGTYGRGAWKMEMPVKTQQPIAINTLDIADFALFPNPASENLHIKLNGKSAETVAEIFTLNGTAVLTKTFNSTDLLNIDVSGIPPGTYMVKLSAEGKSVVKKLVVV